MSSDAAVYFADGLAVGYLEPEGGTRWDAALAAATLRVEARPFPEEPIVQISISRSGPVAWESTLTARTVWRANTCLFIIRPADEQQDGLVLRCPSCTVADEVQYVVDTALQRRRQGGLGQASSSSKACTNGSRNIFDQKTDKSSSDLYFTYYGCLMHQQNMLQDWTRTGTYYMAIVENKADFDDKIVMDVGAGSGILSLFSAQAGARKVYAVEASAMAKFARQLADSNPDLGSRIEVINGKVEEVQVPEKVDLLVSEPMGTLLVNERMLETYLYARDHFLKPGGKMYPQIGRIHVAAFSDEQLYMEVLGKSYFWLQQSFYGVNITDLYGAATESYFAQVVVDAFDPNLLVSSCATKVFDFLTVSEADLTDISIPLSLQVNGSGPCYVHGLAAWFDVYFNGSTQQIWLSTAPGLPTTHWFQLRCVLKTPICFPTGTGVLTGSLRLVAHNRQSYNVHITLQGPPAQPDQPPQVASGVYDLKEPFYRQLTAVGAAWQQQQQQQGTSVENQEAA